MADQDWWFPIDDKGEGELHTSGTPTRTACGVKIPFNVVIAFPGYISSDERKCQKCLSAVVNPNVARDTTSKEQEH